MTRQRYKVDLEQEIWHRTRAKAIENGVTAGAIVEDALRQYLYGSQPAKPVPAVRDLGPVVNPLVVPVAAVVAPLGDLDDELAASSFTPVPKPVRAGKSRTR